MFKVSVSIRDLDFNKAADVLLPNEWKGILIKAGIRLLPAKEQLTTVLVNANKGKIMREINKSTEKKSLPLRVNHIQIKHY